MARWPDIFFSGYASRASLSQAAKAGSIVRLGRGIYTGRRMAAPETVTREHWREIVAHEFPGAVLADRSARQTRPDLQGRVCVVHKRQRPLVLPGLSIVPRPGPTGIEGDTPTPDGLVISSPARGLLDNLGGRGDRYLSTVEVEHWVADILDVHGVDRLNQVRDHARRIAPALRRDATMQRLDRMVAAALTSGPADAVESGTLQARALGQPYDHARIELFTSLADSLTEQAPAVLPDEPSLAPRRAMLPFYEAYFSNYIEGTEFTLDEAADIALRGVVPAERPADAHDILGTYRITSDPVAMAQVPRSDTELLELLRDRHRAVMEGRPDHRPGSWKTAPNRAGATFFVQPAQVEGTLRAGFEVGRRVVGALARATYMTFMVAEVHPFAGGNGRVSRLMMNGELVATGEVRIIIPTVYRNNYLAALRTVSHNANHAGLYATLEFARRYTARVDFSSRAAAEADLARTSALLDANVADANGIRLIMP